MKQLMMILIVILSILVITFVYMKYNDCNDEHFTFAETDIEAIHNIASIYNKSDMQVTNLTTTGALTAANGNFNLLPAGIIVAWSGKDVPFGWALCDGTNGTPDLRDKFLVGSGKLYKLGDTGGANEITLTIDQMPRHRHGINGVEPSGWAQTGVYFGLTDQSNRHPLNVDPTQDTISPAEGSGTKKGLKYPNPLGATGDSKPHENRPPYYAVAYIIKL